MVCVSSVGFGIRDVLVAVKIEARSRTFRNKVVPESRHWCRTLRPIRKQLDRLRPQRVARIFADIIR